MEEIAGALQMPEWWKGQMSLESLRTWIESDPKVAPLGARLNESAVRFKEDELLRALFDEIDRDGSGDLDPTEMMRLGDVTHVTLTVEECTQIRGAVSGTGGHIKSSLPLAARASSTSLQCGIICRSLSQRSGCTAATSLIRKLWPCIYSSIRSLVSIDHAQSS